ncbi:hypothetical protein K461DRAFT_158685 [Myriangium duriaei CBS 260.36]|uniref:BTB domain-containing protein n=1 Tax=Myriangium duriaei CBS 260.36 TaxID=1168546 RepID=A0A9P4MJA5_9PEZI|nr:hypothetical protein K461DRAFT_158685 [Myriangium duriaei CBS 260.36]
MKKRPASPSGMTSSKRRRVKGDFMHTAKVLVGRSEVQFSVHTAKICKASPFFRAALKGNWLEAKEQTIRLPEDDAKTFEDFLEWVYSNNIELEFLESSKQSLDIRPLIKLYLLTEKLQVPACNERILDLLVSNVDQIKSIPASAISAAWDATTGTIGLRRFFRDWFLLKSTVEDIEFDLVKKAPGFATSTLRAFIWSRKHDLSTLRFSTASEYLNGATVPLDAK